jgi:hypothetical protein
MATPEMKPLPNTTCPLCGGLNECAPAAAGHFNVECWCTTAVISPEALKRVPSELVNKACLCPRCAGLVAEPTAPGP